MKPSELAQEANLHYINPDSPGFSRQGQENLFRYQDLDGKNIIDKKTLDRMAGLKIPPAWKNVWISPSPTSHIQAIGIDDKHRKQYIYHPEWSALSQENKFQKMLFFSKILPEIRQKVASDMATPGLSQQKVLATIIWLLEHTYIRIGNKTYAKENQHFGLTTLRNKHVNSTNRHVTFQFIGKGGKEREIAVTHPKVIRTIHKLESLPGYELFQYLEPGGKRHVVTSDEVNEYLQSTSGDTISAKDFRTWGGTTLSAQALYILGEPDTKRDMKKNISHAVKEVARKLRNTPKVARTYYIHPTIPRTYEEYILVSHLEKIKQEQVKTKNLSRVEYAVKTLLEMYSTS